MHMKMSSAELRPFCRGLNVLKSRRYFFRWFTVRGSILATLEVGFNMKSAKPTSSFHRIKSWYVWVAIQFKISNYMKLSNRHWIHLQIHAKKCADVNLSINFDKTKAMKICYIKYSTCVIESQPVLKWTHDRVKILCSIMYFSENTPCNFDIEIQHYKTWW